MTLKYFKLSEFDSPDLEGSGSNMNYTFLEKLDQARGLAGIPFKITSGFRTEAYQDDLTRRGYKTAKKGTSPHLKGLAADISVKDSRQRFIVINSLLLAGFTRLGIGDNFIHVDLSTYEGHRQNVIWKY
tara:strand:+ start:331 stop:717 length:387 start_codon:yes stop_codon:yes gene_type:complete